MARLKFRDWYVARHGDWPGFHGDPYHVIFQAMTDGMADYIDEVVADIEKGRPPPQADAEGGGPIPPPSRRAASSGKEPCP